jgi:TonB family protein
MTTVNKKPGFVAGFLVLATVITITSCGNDANSSAEHLATLPDTSTKLSEDTTAAKPVTKMKKGRASVTVIMDNTLKIEKDKDGIYSRAEKMPEYPGGEAALSNFVENNTSYPQDAIDQDAEGTVNVSFVVDEKGKAQNPVVTGKTAGHGLDEEAIKIVKQMPAWKPGMVKGKPVKTRLLLPVTFKLADV